MKLEKEEALTLVGELIRAGKVSLPNRACEPLRSGESGIQALARTQASYLRALLEELTKEDEETE